MTDRYRCTPHAFLPFVHTASSYIHIALLFTFERIKQSSQCIKYELHIGPEATRVQTPFPYLSSKLPLLSLSGRLTSWAISSSARGSWHDNRGMGSVLKKYLFNWRFSHPEAEPFIVVVLSWRPRA